MSSPMDSKACEFQVPNSNLKYLLQVFSDGDWIIYTQIGISEPDWANPITSLSHVKRSVLQSIKLQISKFQRDLEAG